MTGTNYTIVLDASRDLYEGGYDNDGDSCDAFVAEYRAAAAEYAARNEIEIEVVEGNYEGDMSAQSDNGDEAEVWQAIHNLVLKARRASEAAKLTAYK